MCTLALMYRMWASTPLLVAANRDEKLDRPAEPPSRSSQGDSYVVAPRDAKAGGTWIGVNSAGLFACITNRFGRSPDPTRPSRGRLVTQALGYRRARDAADQLAGLIATEENGFHLVVADREEAFVIVCDTSSISQRPLPAGLHIVTERSFDAAPTAREPLLRGLLEPQVVHGPPDDATLHRLLATHAEPSFDGVCVHLPEIAYGTRSSTLIRMGPPGQIEIAHAGGPPCTHAFRPCPRP